MGHGVDARPRASLRLGPVLGRGGEGAVHAIEGRLDQVAKIYSVTPDEPKVRKLRAMTKVASPPLLKVAAWPTGLLNKRGLVCGFLMPRVAARRDIHELYGPRAGVKPSQKSTSAFWFTPQRTSLGLSPSCTSIATSWET